MTTMRKVLHNLIKNDWYTLIGAVITVCGIDLWTNSHYFFWPPQYASLMNNNNIDAVATFVGVGLIIYAAVGIHSNAIISILLGVSAAFGTAIAFAFYVHMTFARQAMLSVPLALAVFFVVTILKVAFTRNTRE